MSTFGPLMDAFERMMAAVAFAESNDRETAIWFMQPESARQTLRNVKQAGQQPVNRPEMRV